MTSYSPLTPRSADGIVRVALNGRVSTTKQDKGNIEASFVPLRRLLKELWGGPIEPKEYGEQSSGEDSNRPELKRLFKEIESDTLDANLAEDLGRFSRDEETLWELLNTCKKHRVRVICPGDGLDTANENWKKVAHTAIGNHCGSLDDTKRRIKRTASKTFFGGGQVVHETPGYRKLTLTEAAARVDVPGLRLQLIAECRPIVEDARRKIVTERYSYAMLADHFNKIGFKPSARVKTGLWNGDLVRRWLRSTILYGKRQHRVHLSGRDPVNKVKMVEVNPAPDEMHYDALAFMTEEQFVEMQAVLDQNGSRQPKGDASGAVQKRLGVPRRDTLFPRQQVRCVICKGYYQDGANGGFRCANGVRRARKPCWCHLQIRLAVLVPKLIDWLLRVLTSGPPEVLDRLFAVALEELHALQSTYHQEIGALQAQIDGHRVAIDKLVRASGLAKSDQIIAECVAHAERHANGIGDAEAAIAEVEAAMHAERRPQTMEELSRDPRSALLDLAANSFDFGVLMRRVIPTIFVQPLQAIDSGLMRARLTVELDLSSLLRVESTPLAIEVHTIDAFDEAQPFEDRSRVIEARGTLLAEGLPAGPAAVARWLALTKTRVCRAMKLHAMMLKESLAEPYRVLTHKPEWASRQRKRKKPSDLNAAV